MSVFSEHSQDRKMFMCTGMLMKNHAQQRTPSKQMGKFTCWLSDSLYLQLPGPDSVSQPTNRLPVAGMQVQHGLNNFSARLIWLMLLLIV